MKDLIELYCRYDGPPPRLRDFKTNRRHIENMLRLLLHAVRRRRRDCRDLELLAPLVRQVGGTLRILKTN